ncbi:MAG TPA: radical SAM protein [Anaeromyxobacteraceae bacterium]|nr:radical SAM protein [Anaeromyxobacteraceae bacterium]
MHTPLAHARSLFWKRRPVHLTLFVTGSCNLRCPFCFHRRAPEAPDPAPELSLDEIGRVARSMDSLLWLLFSGGEPFLRRDLVEVSALFHQVNRPAFLTYPTNGWFPEVIADRTEEILRSCPESVVVVKVSLDGVGADHDALRRAPGGFERVVRTLERLASLAGRHRRLEVGVNTLFCRENQERMEAIVDFVAGLDGVRSHTLTVARPVPGVATAAGVDPALYRRAGLHLEARWRARRHGSHRFAGAGLKSAQDRLQRRLVHRTLLERRRVVPCYAGRLDLVLSESGDLYPCEGRWDASFGNVRQAGYDVPGMLRSARARRVFEALENGECHCTNECNFLVNILFNPRMHPGLLRHCAGLPPAWPGRDEAPRQAGAG